jgi:DNA-binding YbaB/EbfC family protein
MFKEIGQLASLLKQAQGMQGKIAESKERLAKLECVGDAGGGMVTVTVSGGMRVVDCHVAQQLIDAKDKQMLESLVVAATNDALAKLLALQAQEMGAITGGMDLGGINNALSNMGFGNR